MHSYDKHRWSCVRPTKFKTHVELFRDYRAENQLNSERRLCMSAGWANYSDLKDCFLTLILLCYRCYLWNHRTYFFELTLTINTDLNLRKFLIEMNVQLLVVMIIRQLRVRGKRAFSNTFAIAARIPWCVSFRKDLVNRDGLALAGSRSSVVGVRASVSHRLRRALLSGECHYTRDRRSLWFHPAKKVGPILKPPFCDPHWQLRTVQRPENNS